MSTGHDSGRRPRLQMFIGVALRVHLDHALRVPAFLTALGVLLACAAPLAGQAVRVTGATTFRYIEIRPFVRDSVPADSAAGSGVLRQTADGRVVRCVPGEAYCANVRPGGRTSSVPVMHDMEANAWGLGTGVRLFAHVRARTSFGGDAGLWPRGDDAFDVLAMYGELERTRVRVRLGRQWQSTGLGFYNFDGLSVSVRPARSVWVEAYGGRSLLRGLNESRGGGALEAVEAFAPPSSGVLLGTYARYRRDTRFAIGSGYHVEFRTDGRGLYSELAMADAMVRASGVSLAGSVELDVASAALNEARLSVSTGSLGRVMLNGELRRYRPYFELWTIWGAFDPVGFDEVRSGAAWSPTAHVIVRGEASYRRYGEAGRMQGLAALRTDGWGLGAGVSWSPTARWQLDTSWHVEVAAGAARRDIQGVLSRRFGDIATLSMQGLAFQRFYEFRLDESTVAGLGAEASVRASDRLRLFATAAAYRHLGAGDMAAMDWTQRRATLRVQWTAGAEPGLPGAAERPR
ncbi:MAG TPA: hypothetical protein VK933_14535 [Longimicrobiales bacterium]|nr:hypothetical protein [Longimicrobiales bacterium]